MFTRELYPNEKSQWNLNGRRLIFLNAEKIIQENKRFPIESKFIGMLWSKTCGHDSNSNLSSDLSIIGIRLKKDHCINLVSKNKISKLNSFQVSTDLPDLSDEKLRFYCDSKSI